MDRRETIAMLTWVNQVDPRVMLNEAAAELWAHTMAPFDSGEAKQAILEHYRTNESIAATPGAIRKRAQIVRNTRDAQQSALTGPPAKPKTEADYRRKIRETPAFMAAFEAGRREGNAERAYATVLRETGDRNQAFAARDRILRGEAEAA